ncbi:unknown [Prevotella sp. CAG:1124]|jgi:hypothetical protein|nr:unknown [Prevotella sp. CAG:1124]
MYENLVDYNRPNIPVLPSKINCNDLFVKGKNWL